MAATCPCCGSPLRDDVPYAWDRSRGVLTTHVGESGHIAYQEARVLDAIIRSPWKYISTRKIIDAAWPLEREPSKAHRSVFVYVCRLRKALAPAGVTIPNMYRHGYRIEFPAPPEKRSAA